MYSQIAFFIDVDNTLIDNDCIKMEIKKSLQVVLGVKEAGHFWRHHDEFRSYEKIVDFPKIIRRYCSEKHQDRCELIFNQIFNEIQFGNAIYPNVFEVLLHLRQIGKVNLFTEGDSLYQKMKIDKSGLYTHVDSVFLFEHKLDHVLEVMEKFGNDKKVFIDDRAAVLLEIKKQFSEIYAIEVMQGHYSTIDHIEHVELDRKISQITELLKLKREDFIRK